MGLDSGSRCTPCCNGFFVPRQYINFMSQQATTGSLCRAKQCLIGFQSMATPPEACFHLLFQQHLERNGGDYIPPVVSRRFSPRRPLGIPRWQSRSVLPPLPCCSCWQTLSCHLHCCRCCAFSYNTAETHRFKVNHDKTYQINYGTNTGTVKIPDSKRESICTDMRFTSLLQSKLNLLSFRELLRNTKHSLWFWLFVTWSRTIKRHLFYNHTYQESKWFSWRCQSSLRLFICDLLGLLLYSGFFAGSSFRDYSICSAVTRE